MSFARALMWAGLSLVHLAPAAADDAARISYLESQIQSLRTQLDEQGRKIARLEEQLARLAAGGAGARPTTRPPARAAASPQGPQPWHSAEAWARLSKGMTQEQVVAILGTPTAIEAVDDFKTLFYRSANAAGARPGGIVNLRGDRVVAIVPPGT